MFQVSVINDNRYRGRVGLALAISYFTMIGCTISLPLNDTQWYDLIVEKNGIFKTVQCKCTSTDNGNISLRSCGGTDGGTYDNVLNHPVDLLFCVDRNMNMFLIPVADIRASGNVNCIGLTTEPNPRAKLDTSKYLLPSYM